MPNKLTTEEFIRKATNVHGNKYDYSKVHYVSIYTKIIITCPVHGDFFQCPHDHLKTRGCSACSNNTTLTTRQFIEKAKKVHGDRYDYSMIRYTKS